MFACGVGGAVALLVFGPSVRKSWQRPGLKMLFV